MKYFLQLLINMLHKTVMCRIDTSPMAHKAHMSQLYLVVEQSMCGKKFYRILKNLIRKPSSSGISGCNGSFTLPDSDSDSDSDSQCNHWGWDPSLDLCNVNNQHITIVAKGKTLPIRVRVRIRVRQCKRAINSS